MSPPLLAFEGIAKSFFGIPVVRDVSFPVQAGRVLGLVGENGAGKSTLMNILGGVLKPDAGRLLLAGEPYAPTSPLDAARRGIAFIHQELNLFSNLTVAENMFVASFPRRRGFALFVDRRSVREKAAKLLRDVNLAVSPDTPVESLSPGERQLVEIAKALGGDARVVIFDEPTTSLTAPETERLFTLIDRLRAEGRAIIYISHALGDVLRLADELVVLRDGAVVANGPRHELSVERLIAAMVGRELSHLFPTRAHAPSSEPLLEAHDITQPGVVEGVGLTVRRGEVLGLAGLMGSGRTELARILFGLDPRERGEIRLAGRRIVADSPRASIACGMALLTENRREEGLLLDASVLDNASLVALTTEGHLPDGGVDPKRIRDEATSVCSRIGIAEHHIRKGAVKTLSGGNQQKVVLAKWLLARPRLFILDEPTRGIDVGAKQEIYGLINELAAGGAGVLLISSELEELLGMCDRILVMRRGEIVGSMERPQFDQQAILRLALGAGTAEESRP